MLLQSREQVTEELNRLQKDNESLQGKHRLHMTLQQQEDFHMPATVQVLQHVWELPVFNAKDFSAGLVWPGLFTCPDNIFSSPTTKNLNKYGYDTKFQIQWNFTILDSNFDTTAN